MWNVDNATSDGDLKQNMKNDMRTDPWYKGKWTEKEIQYRTIRKSQVSYQVRRGIKMYSGRDVSWEVTTKKQLDQKPIGKTPRGRLRKTWLDVVDEVIEDLGIREWKETV